MRVLVLGASGLIGRHVAACLEAAGDVVVRAGRSSDVRIDLADPATPWPRHLENVDAVVNAVGIFREGDRATFEAVHVEGPARLFDACVGAGVRRVVQVSALGADASATTPFHRSKLAADERLLSLPLDATVVQPSLVFSAEGASAQLFLRLAALPVIPLPAGGPQPIQPVHIDDAAAAICALVHAPPRVWRGRRVPLDGPRALTLRQFMLAVRSQLHIAGQPTCVVPRPLMHALARLGDRVPGAMFDSDAWSMLERGNVADPTAISRLLGRQPLPAEHWIGETLAPRLRLQAQMPWLKAMLRITLAAVWIWTAFVSVFVYPLADSIALLLRAGLPAALTLPALWLAAGLDLVLGVLTLAPLAERARRWLWAAQALLIIAYTAVITARLPEFWSHPYGPLSKNLPMLGVLWMLWTLDRVRKPD
jgi:uncharacterized protein YbjT (DUF2867 family)